MIPNLTAYIQLWQGTEASDAFTGDDRRDYMYGAGGDDRLNGRGGHDKLYGEAGNDKLFGGTGNDLLSGGINDDELQGEAGADTIDGGDGVDWAAYYRSDAGVTVDLSTGGASGGHAEGDVLTEIENLWGSRYNDALTGDAGDNQLRGDDGDDTLSGDAGRDTLSGGDGQDTIYGGTGNDTIDAGSGHDVVHAGYGSDVIEGGLGDDVITTGSGGYSYAERFDSDTIVFGDYHGAGFGNDRVTDFNASRDLLDVSALDISFDDVNVLQINGGTLITFDGVEGTLVLDGVLASTMTAADFLF